MPSRQRTKNGTKRPSRVRHDRGLRADGTKRSSRMAHEAQRDATRPKRKGGHTRTERLTWPFWGIDGEGAGESAGHEYILLRSGSRELSYCYWWDPSRPGHFPEFMAFLAGTVPDKVIPVAYGLDYDVTMWIKSLPEEIVAELLDREARTDPDDPFKVRPVKAHGYEIDWLPGHFFQLRTVSGRRIRISNVQRFFGCPFTDALRSQGIEPPAWMDDIKARRRDFTRAEVLGPQVAEYNRQEVILLEELMTKFRAGCIAAGVVPRHWEGPGAGASVLLKAWNSKDHLSGAFNASSIT